MNSGNNKNSKSRFLALWQLLLLLALVVLGILLHVMGVFDWQIIYQWAQASTQYWWTVVVLIILQALLYTFALPGSLLLWVVAPLYEPITGTIILVTGSTLGALLAYLFAKRGSLAWTTRVQQSHVFHLLKARGDFLSLCALRLMPSFPHSVINYGAGILQISYVQFIISSMIGFTVKAYLYCSAIHGAITVADPSELIRADIVGPLVVLTLITVLSELLRIRWSRRRENKENKEAFH